MVHVCSPLEPDVVTAVIIAENTEAYVKSSHSLRRGKILELFYRPVYWMRGNNKGLHCRGTFVLRLPMTELNHQQAVLSTTSL
jgi:hypothetical protein